MHVCECVLNKDECVKVNGISVRKECIKSIMIVFLHSLLSNQVTLESIMSEVLMQKFGASSRHSCYNIVPNIAPLK